MNLGARTQLYPDLKTSPLPCEAIETELRESSGLILISGEDSLLQFSAVVVSGAKLDTQAKPLSSQEHQPHPSGVQIPPGNLPYLSAAEEVFHL